MLPPQLSECMLAPAAFAWSYISVAMSDMLFRDSFTNPSGKYSVTPAAAYVLHVSSASVYIAWPLYLHRKFFSFNVRSWAHSFVHDTVCHVPAENAAGSTARLRMVPVRHPLVRARSIVLRALPMAGTVHARVKVRRRVGVPPRVAWNCGSPLASVPSWAVPVLVGVRRARRRRQAVTQPRRVDLVAHVRKHHRRLLPHAVVLGPDPSEVKSPAMDPTTWVRPLDRAYPRERPVHATARAR